MPQGKYIVIEGLDGSGKTTQHERLLARFQKCAIGVREPGGTPMAEEIRTLLKSSALSRAPRTNTFLFSAARADLIDTIVRPAIGRGQHVIADRNWLSTVAYQISEDDTREKEIYQLCALATEEFFQPDMLVFLDTKVTTCLQRMQLRPRGQKDYFERKGEPYFTQVRENYLAHIVKLPHYRIINGDRAINDIASEIEGLISSLLEK